MSAAGAVSSSVGGVGDAINRLLSRKAESLGDVVGIVSTRFTVSR